MSAIVVGGVFLGLSAAHTLLQGGAKVTLIEKNPFLGGNSTKATSGLNGAGSRTQAKMGSKTRTRCFWKTLCALRRG